MEYLLLGLCCTYGQWEAKAGKIKELRNSLSLLLLPLGYLPAYARITLLRSELFPCDDFRRFERTFKVVEGVTGRSRRHNPYEFPAIGS
jgi:hypothetical protein